jgi:hypothetical protein
MLVEATGWWLGAPAPMKTCAVMEAVGVAYDEDGRVKLL